MTTSNQPERAARSANDPLDPASNLDRHAAGAGSAATGQSPDAKRSGESAAGTADTDLASGLDDPRQEDSLDRYGVSADGITDGASSAGSGAYGAGADATRAGTDEGKVPGEAEPGKNTVRSARH